MFFLFFFHLFIIYTFLNILNVYIFFYQGLGFETTSCRQNTEVYLFFAFTVIFYSNRLSTFFTFEWYFLLFFIFVPVITTLV